jgi:hypothetical protein
MEYKATKTIVCSTIENLLEAGFFDLLRWASQLPWTKGHSKLTLAHWIQMLTLVNQIKIK